MTFESIFLTETVKFLSFANLIEIEEFNKDNFINNENYLYENTSENRKKFEILKRKYIRKDGNHKRGFIRGECKYLKKAKASLSRSFSTLVKKKLIRKISIIDYENKEIGIGFNLTELGKKTINEKK